MSDRQQRGLALAALYRIEKQGGKWLVPSQSGNGTKYAVDPNPAHPTCTCPDHRDRGIKCKHMFAVEFVQTREVNPADGSETVTRTFKVTEKVTYKQDWPAYNAAQQSEKRLFLQLLADLCRGVPDRPRSFTKGRPPLPLGDVIFAVVFKVYSTVSTRRFTCDLQDAAAKGFIRKPMHYNSVINGFEDADITPILKRLITESSKPLRAVDTTFAVDSSGFATSRFVRWFDIKYGESKSIREWVKVHLMTGTHTNVVTAVEILDKDANDCPQLPGLVNATAETFKIGEVSADAAYSSQDNMQAIDRVGGVPFIAFKENATGGIGGLFAKMFHFYSYRKDEFLKHYHKRSNAESTFSMIKAKFGDSVRSKSDVAMVNEVLAKILAHNICCLIQSAFELGVQSTFWATEETSDAPAPSVESADVAEVFAWL